MLAPASTRKLRPFQLIRASLMKRSFLFLQGPASPFFALLGEELLDLGHRVLRINFNSGDKFFWNGENTADYKHPLTEFTAYISNVARLRKITDLVIYDDTTPINRAAIEALKNQKIRLHVFDDGYFGENWVTLEDRIFGNKTVLPKDPRFYLRSLEQELPRVKKFGSSARAKTLYMLQYYLAGIFSKTNDFSENREYHPREEFGNLSRSRIFKFFSRLKQDRARAKLGRLNYFLADYELSRKESFLRSFAANAAEDEHLVFISKTLINSAQAAKTHEMAEKHNIADRLHLVENGNFKPLVKSAKAYITNSSIDALVAIKYGKPVMAIESSIYNIKGLTSQLALNDFWKTSEMPDAELFRKFRNYVIAKTQVNGSFYNRKGMKLALKISTRKILGKEGGASDSEAFDAS